MKHRLGKAPEDKPSNKQSLYLDSDVADEMRAHAERLDRSMSWVVHRAWRIARAEIMGAPTEALGSAAPPDPKPQPKSVPVASPGASQLPTPPSNPRFDAFAERYRAEPQPPSASPWGDIAAPDPQPTPPLPTPRRFGVF